jgi:hypothetical protein
MEEDIVAFRLAVEGETQVVEVIRQIAYRLTNAPAVNNSSASYIHMMVKLSKIAMMMPPPTMAGTAQNTNIPNRLLMSMSRALPVSMYVMKGAFHLELIHAQAPWPTTQKCYNEECRPCVSMVGVVAITLLNVKRKSTWHPGQEAS